MYFQHSDAIWSRFPNLAAGVLYADGLDSGTSVTARLAPYQHTAESRLADATEGEFPEVQAWRRAFSTMGLKPTQYRSASESLLRRFRKEGSLPEIHPLIDLCNAVSLAYAIPVAVFDTTRISGGIEVRPADGTESYLAFSGQSENPERDEVIFADEAGQAHARRWTNRQSAHSTARDSTSSVLVVAEALHESAATDVQHLISTLVDELHAIWSVKAQPAQLSSVQPRFEFRVPRLAD